MQKGARRIVDHLQHGLNDPKNDVLFVGYQAKGTPGRKLLEKKTPCRATIHSLSAYSAHADQQMLVNWVRSMPEPPKEIRLVHGELKAKEAIRCQLLSDPGSTILKTRFLRSVNG